LYSISISTPRVFTIGVDRTDLLINPYWLLYLSSSFNLRPSSKTFVAPEDLAFAPTSIVVILEKSVAPLDEKAELNTLDSLEDKILFPIDDAPANLISL
jgi:hypothetical protein